MEHRGVDNMILGLDMSSNKSGYSLFTDNKELKGYGVWEVPDDIDNWRDKIVWMGDRVSECCDKYNVDKIICEDVPLMLNNPQTLKILCALQGIIMGICVAKRIPAKFVAVAKWRKDLGLFTGKRKDMERDEMKKASIEYANKTFGLDLIWKSKSSKFNQDDISDGILVAYSQIK